MTMKKHEKTYKRGKTIIPSLKDFRFYPIRLYVHHQKLIFIKLANKKIDLKIIIWKQKFATSENAIENNFQIETILKKEDGACMSTRQFHNVPFCHLKWYLAGTRKISLTINQFSIP